VAGSGAQARSVARKFNPDLILLDVVMPDQSGFAVCEALQSDPATRHIRVIFISALSGTPTKVMGFETGGHDYLTKPFNPGELAARVGAHLREKYVEDELREKQAKLSALVDPSAAPAKHA
jgi:DNA-binding response OmpR family regulator